MKKGVLKGFKYISQIFEEEEEEEMQIGLPTDVKHVAHIGTDGPATESPSWMKEFKAPERPRSAPLDNTGEPLDSSNQTSRDMPDLPKESRRTQSLDLTIETPGRESSTKSRRHQRKDSSEGSHKSRRRHHRKDSSSDREGSSRSGHASNSQELISSNGDVPESSSRKLPDIPKSSRRKKSKDDNGSTKSSKSKANNDVPSQTTTYACPFTDPGLVANESTISCNSECCRTS